MWMSPSALASMPSSFGPTFVGFSWISPQMSMANAAYQLSWSSTGASPTDASFSPRAKNTSSEPTTRIAMIRAG